MNAAEVLKNVEAMLADERTKSWDLDKVYNKLGIFDWFTSTLSRTRLKQMRDFLTASISLGYTGHVDFKVGAAWCAHGMWAYKQESETGYSPDGACLYHSFRPGDNFWAICWEDGSWLRDECGNHLHLHGAREVMKALVAHELA